jgi:serine/threonine protein kinase
MLTDFGVSRVIAASAASFKGSTRWMAPELLIPESDEAGAHEPVEPNQKTDIWAFGMTIYVSNCKPFLSGQ